MNRSEYTGDDRLSSLIQNDEPIKAPDDFTDRVMNMIAAEQAVTEVRAQRSATGIVPMISVIVTVGLTVLALLLPEKTRLPEIVGFLNFVNKIKLPAVTLNIDSLFSHTLPAITIYLIAGIALIAIFDKFLSGMFYRK